MCCESTVQFCPLGLGNWQGFRVVGDAIPNRLNELDAFFNTQAQDLFKLG